MTAAQQTASVDLDLLLRARLFIARLGERDVRSWWATDGILGSDGAFVGPRVLPKTHGTARARIAFAVVRHACLERHPDTSVHHLFSLDPEIEDRLDAFLVERLDAFDWWAETLGRLEKIEQDVDAAAVLQGAGITSADDLTHVSGLKLGPDARSLPVEVSSSWDGTVRRLAAGFCRSEPGGLAVPYLTGSMPPTAAEDV